MGLKEFTHANYSACQSPSSLPENKRVKIQEEEVGKLQQVIKDSLGYDRKTFLGRLTPFRRLLFVAQGPEGAKILLEYLANPEEIKKRAKKDRKIAKILKTSNIQSLDALQREKAADFLSRLVDHPRLHWFLKYPAKIRASPEMLSAVNLVVNDPSYFLYIPYIYWLYQKYWTKIYLKEGLASGYFHLKFPFIDKEFIFIPSFLQFGKKVEVLEEKIKNIKKAGQKVSFPLQLQLFINKRLDFLWKFLWSEDSFGFHKFILSDPTGWAKDKAIGAVRNWAIKSLRGGSLRIIIQRTKKFFYQTLIKVFGKQVGAAIIKKITTGAAIKTIGAILGALLGISVGPAGWVGTAIFVYSLLRDIFPQIKTLEKLLALGIGMIIYGAFSLLSSLFTGLGGLIGGGLSALGGMVSSLIGGLTTATVTAPVAAVGAGLGGVAIMTVFNALTMHSAFVEYQKAYAPIFYSNCYVKDIHKTDTITPENKANFIAKWKALFPNSLLEEKIDEVINKSVAAGFNPALTVAIWGEESHFSNYGSAGGESNIVEGNDFGCGVKCSDSRPTNFDESLGCFIASRPSCNNQCLSKTSFSEFMECYGPAAENPNFISNTLVFYRELVPSGPDAMECPGGTTGTFASNLINRLLSCYDNGGIINNISLNDNGECLKNNGVPPISVSHIVASISNFSALQCVGFAKAVEAGTGAGSGFTSASFGNAKDYFQELPGYQLIYKNQNNVMVGDLAFFTGESGHVGIVIETRGEGEGSQFRIAQAIGVAPDGSWYGLVNESGWLHISWPSLLGFLRRNP